VRYAILLMSMLVLSCANPPKQKHSPNNQLADAFQHYKGQALKVGEDFDILQQTPPLTKDRDDGFTESSWFISYWANPECLEGYIVFERCELSACDYKFEWVEGVCD